MKKYSLLFSFLFWVSLSKGQGFTPITTTGYNFDAIAETFPFGALGTTATMDLSNYVLFSQAFGVSGGFGAGIINSGTIVSGTNTYQLRAFNTTNALHLTAGSGTLTLTTPARYTQLSLLGFATEGNSTIQGTVNYTDGTTTAFGPFTVNDWFFGAGAVYAGFGRMSRVNAAPYNMNGAPTDPRMYPYNIDIPCASEQKNVASVTISHLAGNHTFIMAISGVVTPTVTANGGSTCAGLPLTLTSSVSATGGTYSWSPSGGSAATASVSPMGTTTYTLSYTLSGCTYTDTAVVNVVPGPTISATPASFCSGGAGVIVTASGAGAGGTYTWSPSTGLSATTGSSVTATPAGTTTYTVTGTTSLGCTGSTTVAVTVNPSPTITCPAIAICAGSSGTLTASGAGAGGTYVWSPGTGLSATAGASVTASPATTTTYTITGTNSFGCSNTTTATVTVNNLPILNVNNAAVCSGTSVVLNATGASTYSWSPGTYLSGTTGSSVTSTPVTSITYTVSGTDVNGCIGTTTSTVTISASLDATITPPAALCVSSASQILTSATPGGTWSATCGGCINSVTGSFDPSISGPGTFTLTYTIPGACGSTDTELILVNPNDDASFIFPASICASAAPVSLVPATTGGTWTSTCGTCVTAAGVFDPSLAAIGSNDITYTTSGTCPMIQTNSIDVVNLVINSVPVTDALCNGSADGTITVNAPGAVLFNIGGGFVGTNTFTVGAGTYTVTVEDAGGCQENTTVTINEPAVMTVPISTTDPSCAGVCDGIIGTAPFGGTAPYTYAWSNGTTSPFVTAACDGSYTITVTDDNGCTASNTGVLIAPVAVNIISITPTSTLCNGSADGMVSIIASATVTSFTLAGSTQTTGDFTGLSAGTYPITVADASGCSATATITVTEPSPVSVNANSDLTICSGQSAAIGSIATGGTAPYTYTWTDASGSTVGSGAAATVTPLTSGSHNYTITVVDANGCGPTNDVQTITVAPPLNVVASVDQTICPGDLASINATATGGNGGPYTYTWINDINSTVLTGQDQNVNPGSTTTYTVTVSDGCTTPQATDVLVVSIYNLPSVTYAISAQQGCVPLTVDFNSTVAAGLLSSYTWNFGDGSFGSDSATSHVFTDDGCYHITLSVETVDGCTTDTTIYSQVCAHPNPVAAFSAQPQPTDVFNTEVIFSNLSIGASTYTWYFENIGNSTTINPIVDFPTDSGGVYNVCLNALSSYGCADSICHEIVVNDLLSVFVPNAFTPDGDGLNEIFLPIVRGEEKGSYQFYVFDRWGQLIFNTNDTQKGWDGTHKNIKSKEDVYVWKILIKNTLNEDVKEYRGHVSLLR